MMVSLLLLLLLLELSAFVVVASSKIWVLEFVLLAVVLLEVVVLVVELLPAPVEFADVSFIDFSGDSVLEELVSSVPIVEFALVAVVVLLLFDSVVFLPSSIMVGAIDGRSDTVGNSVGTMPSGKSVGASVSLLEAATKCVDERSRSASAHGRRKGLVGAMVTNAIRGRLCYPVACSSWPSAAMGWDCSFVRLLLQPETVRQVPRYEEGSCWLVTENWKGRRLHLKSRLLSIRDR